MADRFDGSTIGLLINGNGIDDANEIKAEMQEGDGTPSDFPNPT